MKSLTIKVFISTAILLGFPAFVVLPGNPIENIQSENEVPPYAKWGRLAMQETKERYPDADIVDYLHIGRDTHEKTSTEKFKLWLRGKRREFGVFIDIKFDNKTENVIHISYRETDR